MAIVTRPGRLVTGNSYIDVDVLRDAGVDDLSKYGGGEDLQYDIFIDR
jgi:citronellol/citronellal dehydrogenase